MTKRPAAMSPRNAAIETEFCPEHRFFTFYRSLAITTRWLCDAVGTGLQTFNQQVSGSNPERLPFLDTYRTMCLAPQPEFRQLLEQARNLSIAA
jgi:hypothetical protein